MRLALIGPTYPYRGGISHYTTLLNKHLRNGHDIRFFSFLRQYPNWLFPGKSDIDPSQLQIRVPGVERTIDSLNPVTWYRTAREIIQYDPAAVILPWWVSFWAPQFKVITSLVKRHSRARIIYICHNVLAHEPSKVDKLVFKSVLSGGDGFLVHSEEDRLNLREILPKAPICKRFHPSYDVFQFSGYTRDVCRKQLGLSGNVLLFFGFVRKYKGLEFLLKSLPLILEQLPVTLLVAGEFWKDRDFYFDLIRKEGIGDHVSLYDEYIPNEVVGQFFCASDLVIQPYVTATGSGVVQMAFGFERPVVATSVGCLSEVVVNGKTGYLIPPAQPEAIASAVITFFKENKSKEFRKNIQENQYRFSWDHLIEGIEQLIDDNVKEP